MINELLEKFEDIFKPPSDEEAKERGKRWLERQFDKSLLIDNGDGTYDYNGDLDFSGIGLTSLLDLPYKLRRVRGDFDCMRCELTSLEGAPREVGRDFYCYNNKLTTLEGAPENVGRDFYCSRNQLTTLEGAPEKVGGDFWCIYNQLTTLEGAPEKVGGGFDCSYNKLTTLEGAPEYVGGDFGCRDNPVSEEKLKKTVNREYLK